MGGHSCGVHQTPPEFRVQTPLADFNSILFSCLLTSASLLLLAVGEQRASPGLALISSQHPLRSLPKQVPAANNGWSGVRDSTAFLISLIRVVGFFCRERACCESWQPYAANCQHLGLASGSWFCSRTPH